MQAQYNWIKDQISQGKTVLAYDRQIAGGKVYRIKSMDRVTMFSGDVWVHGINARGWTFAVKPDARK